MGKYLITGRPGTGKSTVAQAMAEQGYNVFDLEEVPGIVRLEVKATAEPADWPDGYVDWDYYAWNLQEKPLKQFLAKQLTRDVYVAVSASNQRKFYDLFDKIFVLTLSDPEILRHRLKTRNIHEFGQTPKNIQRAVENFETKNAQLLSAGGIPIDNSKPIDIVVQNIISGTHDK